MVVAITASGAVTNSPLVLPVLFMLPLVAAGLAATSEVGRAAMMAIPMPLIIALNAMRVLGVLFLFDAAAGRMSGPFPYFAGIGDIITALFALPVARLAARNPRDVRVLEWNIFGMLDLIVAVSLGTMSAPGSPLQLIHAGAGSAPMTTSAPPHSTCARADVPDRPRAVSRMQRRGDRRNGTQPGLAEA
jgi:hypothetical protein